MPREITRDPIRCVYVGWYGAVLTDLDLFLRGEDAVLDWSARDSQRNIESNRHIDEWTLALIWMGDD